MAGVKYISPYANRNRHTLFTLSDDVTDLGVGAPDPATLRELRDAIRDAAAHRLARPGSETLLQYGPPRGDGDFLDALAAFLGSPDGYGEPVDADRLAATAGASQGVHLLATHFLRPGDTVFVEDPTYFLAIRVLRDLGLNVAALPGAGAARGWGPDPAAFRARCAALPPPRPGRRFRAALYAVPVFGNPTGRSWSEAAMRRVLDVAAEQQVLVLSDDVYHLLDYAAVRRPRPRLVSIDEHRGNVVSVGSFTKIFGPGVRLGWLEAAPSLLRELTEAGYANSGGGFNHLTSGVMTSALELGIQRRVVRMLRDEYGARLRAVSAELRAGLPPGCAFGAPDGGFFTWVELPRGVDAASLLDGAAGRGVAFAPGVRSSPTGGTCAHCLRLSPCAYDAGTAAAAVRRLCSFLREQAAASPAVWRPADGAAEQGGGAKL